MKWRPCRTLGLYIVGCGVLVILALILPGTCWWFFLGIGLVLAGILLMRC